MPPYAKSLAQVFYERQIDVDGSNPAPETVKFHPFVGVAPRRYRELFAMAGARKDSTGRYREWNKDQAIPRLPGTLASSSARSAGEKAELSAFDEEVARAGLTPL